MVLLLMVFSVCIVALMIWNLNVSSPLVEQSPTKEAPQAVASNEVFNWENISPGTKEVSPDKLISELSDQELVGVLTNSDSPEDRILAALNEAEQRRISGLVEAVAYALQNDSYVVRIESIKLLKRLNDKRSVLLLVGILDDHDPAVRGWAAVALGSLGSRKALGYLSSRLAREDQASVKKVIRLAIEKISGLPVENQD